MTDRAAQCPPWHSINAEEAMATLTTSTGGLSWPKLGRIPVCWSQPPAGPPRRAVLARLLAQLDNLLIYVLLASAAVAALLGHAVDALVILGVVVVNAVVGFVQEGRAEQALDADPPHDRPQGLGASRRPPRRPCPPTDSCPGDLVLLEAGRPGAGRPAAGAGAQPQDRRGGADRRVGARSRRSTEPVAADAPLGDRARMAFSGTLVAAGRAPASSSRRAPRPRSAASAPCSARSDARTPLLAPDGRLRPPADRGHPGRLRRRLRVRRRRPRLRDRRRVHGRGRPRGRGDPRRPAGGDDRSRSRSACSGWRRATPSSAACRRSRRSARSR